MAKYSQKHADDKKRFDRTRYAVKIRYTKSEEALVKSYSAKAGMFLTSYIRKASLSPKYKFTPARPAITQQTFSKIMRISLTLELLTMRMKDRYGPNDYRQTEREIADIKLSLNAILEKIGY